MSPSIKKIEDLSKEEILELLNDAAVNWLAHDGLWFRIPVPPRFGAPGNSALNRNSIPRNFLLALLFFENYGKNSALPGRSHTNSTRCSEKSSLGKLKNMKNG